MRCVTLAIQRGIELGQFIEEGVRHLDSVLVTDEVKNLTVAEIGQLPDGPPDGFVAFGPGARQGVPVTPADADTGDLFPLQPSFHGRGGIDHRPRLHLVMIDQLSQRLGGLAGAPGG